MMIEKLYFVITNLAQTFVSVIRIIFLTRIKKFSKVQINYEDLLILANGPSLNSSIEKHLYFTKNKELLCVNFFPNTSYFENLKPRHYVISAPELWREDAIEPYPKLSSELFSNLAKKTNWQLFMWIPYQAKKYKNWRTHLNSNPNIKISYYNPTPIEGFNWFKRLCFDLQLGMPRPHNVLIPSLMLAIKMGYKNIYIWGADHSWLKEISVDENNRVLVNQKHFYDENISKPQPMNKLKGTRKLYEVLQKFIYAFKGYFEIDYYAQKKGINIYNATPGSYIDAFKRYKME
jgi:hypothetical protein